MESDRLLTEEELVTLTSIAYLAGVAVHYLEPGLHWMGDIFGQDMLTALLVLLFGSAMYYGYASIPVALAYGVHTGGSYQALVSLAGLGSYLQEAVAGSVTAEQLTGAVPAQDVLVTQAAALGLSILLCASAAAFGAHLHTRSPRAALGIVVFAAAAYLLHALGAV